jgi:hypothetical protein
LHHKIGREALAVTFYRLQQDLGRDAVEGGKLGIEQHALAS